LARSALLFYLWRWFAFSSMGMSSVNFVSFICYGYPSLKFPRLVSIKRCCSPEILCCKEYGASLPTIASQWWSLSVALSLESYFVCISAKNTRRREHVYWFRFDYLQFLGLNFSLLCGVVYLHVGLAVGNYVDRSIHVPWRLSCSPVVYRSLK